MATVLGQVNLNGCNYQLAYDLLDQNIVGNYSTVRLYGILNVTNNFISWSSGTASVHTSSTGIGTYYSRGAHTLITADFTFNHDSNGNFSQYIEASLNTTFVSGTCGGILNLPQIKRSAITNSVTGSVLEEKFKVDYTKYRNDFSYKLRISIPSVKELEKLPYETSNAEFNLSNETISYLYEYTNNSNTVQLGFAVETWNGNTIISSGNEVIITGRIANANPIFTDFDFEDTNSKTVALTGNNKSFIAGYSNAKITIPIDDIATPQKLATMSKYRAVINDKTVDITYSPDNETNGVIEKITSAVINTYAIDSRNNSTLVTKQADSIIQYNDLIKGNISVSRNNGNTGELVTLNFDGNISNVNFGAKSNSIKKATYTIKRTDNDEIVTGQTDITPTINENKFSFSGVIRGDVDDYGFDINSSYEIKVFIEDELSQIEYNFLLGNGRPNIALHKNGVGIMGAYNENVGGLLQIGGKRVEFLDFYSTEEQVVGTWHDGRPIYKTTIELSSFVDCVENQWTILTDISDLDLDYCVDSKALDLNLFCWSGYLLRKKDDNLEILNTGTTWPIKVITLYYTKTSDKETEK